MDPIEALERNLISESKAYGYTLTIWGAGGLLITVFGVPTIAEVFLYVGGALAGFAALAWVAFTGFLAEETPPTEVSVVVAGMVHVLATIGNLLLSYLLVVALERFGQGEIAYPLVGFQATASYNLLLLIEQFVAVRFAVDE